MLKKRLSELAEIIPGFSFRGAIEDDKNGHIGVLQANNLQPASLFTEVSSLKHVYEEPTNTRAYIKKGDVIIASRGSFSGNSKANVFTGYDKPVVASSSVHIIRILDTSILLPEFLALYLNSSIGQQIISSVVTLATIKTITVKDLRSLNVPMLEIQKQKSLVELNINIQKQEEILKKKTKLKSEIIQGALQVITNK